MNIEISSPVSPKSAPGQGSLLPSADLLRAQADKIRESGVLGRPGLIQRLFDFLLENTLSGKAPKEIEIAIDVFGKSAQFEVSQDAVVRVYVHKLRRKLEEFYVGPGALEQDRITIPRGQYRLTLEAIDPANAPLVPVEPTPPGRFRRWLLAGLAVSVAANVALALWLYLDSSGFIGDARAIHDSPIWSALFDDDMPINIVVGDYYIFGESDTDKRVDRLVRDFNINSEEDLEAYLRANPDQAARYRNLNLQYLPTGVAFALRDILPVLQSTKKPVRMMLRSDLDGRTLKTSHVVYIGYLSGMGMLRDPVFSGSRLSIGDSYDELNDRKTGQQYLSEAGDPGTGVRYHDYGYFSTFTGPARNRVIVISGTRDTGVMHTAEALTSRAKLDELLHAAHGMTQFEALYEVYGVNHTNLDGKLVLTAPIDSAKIWDTD